MTCEQAETLLAELLAGEIAPGDRRAIERHLLECAGCRSDFNRARAGQRVDWPDVAVPPALVGSTRALIARPPLAARLLRLGTAAAAAMILVLFVAASSPRPAVAPKARPAAPILATMQEGAVGALFAKDEDGRPVGDLGLKSHVVSVEILDGVAKTTVEENFENHTDRRLEGTFHFPMPADASISRLALEVNGKMEEGTCLERERAREVFESIVRRMQDPALLEWMPGGMFKCRVFPIEPRATKRVLIAYTQALPFFRGRMTYVYPLASEKTRAHPPGEVRIDVRARMSGRLEKIESPSHRIDVQRRDVHEAAMSFRAASYRPENDFVVAMETSDEEVRVVAHKTDGDDGIFALFLTPRGAGARKPQRTAFVLDVSASVSAPELEVAKRLVRAMMERRIDGDRFQVLAHHIEVESSGDVDLRAANDFMDRLKPVGGSDVLRALLAADADEIVYIGEGTPTMGETDPAKILEAVKGRRIRTVAVGSDANTSLLERLGGHARVSTNDNVARRVAEIAETLGSPVLSDIKIDGGDALYDVVGVRDIFFGERLVVAGRYRGPAAKLVITGRDYRREVEVAFPPKEEGNTYVRRLWAQRKVADLLARGGPKEEVVALGVKHQIMTPHTSFLVLESEQMWKDHQLKRDVPKQDPVLGKDEFRGKIDKLLGEGTDLYKRGKHAEASGKFEEAFQMQPSSDQVYAYIKRVGDDMVARMMNDKERRTQDIGRRLFELAKPGEPLRMGKEVVGKYVQDLRSSEPEVRRLAEWHLRNMGPAAIEALEGRETTTTLSLRNADSRDVAKKLDELIKGEQAANRVEIAPEYPRKESRGPIPANPATAPYDPNPARIERAFRLGARGWDIDDPSGEIGPGFTTNESARLENYDLRAQTFHNLQRMDPLAGANGNQFGGLEFTLGEVGGVDRYPGLDAQTVADPARGQGLELHDMRDILLKLQDFTGPRVEPVSPQAGGAGPLSGATFVPDDSSQAARISDLQRMLDAGGTQQQRLEGDVQVFLRQQEVQLAQIQELTTRIESNRAKLAKSLNEKGLVPNPRDTAEFARRMTERLSQDLAELEEKHVELAREKLAFQEKVNHLNQLGVKTDIAPKKTLEGKVTAVANEIGLMVISQGKDHGVLEGDEFTVYRGGDFVAKVLIDRADARWSAGKVVLKKSDPRPGDDVSNHIFVSAPRAEFVDAARISTASLVSGQPANAVDTARLMERFALKTALEAEMTRDAEGRLLGQLQYDPQTRVFVVRDRVAALDRMGAVVRRLDVETKPEYATIARQASMVVSISRRDGALAEIVEELRRRTGWTITLDAKNIPDDARIDEFIVVNEPARQTLAALAAKAKLVLEERGPTSFHLWRPAHVTFNFRDVDVSVVLDLIRRVDGARIEAPPAFRGKITLAVESLPWTGILATSVKLLGYTTVREADGSVRVIHPDELLRQMEVRVVQLKHVLPPDRGAIDEIRPILNALLSRDAQGRAVGDVGLDGKELVVRDAAKVRERVREIVGLLDLAPGQPLAPFQCRTLPAGKAVDLLREVREKLAAGAALEPAIGDLCAELREMRQAEIAAAMEVADAADSEVLFRCGAWEGLGRGRFVAISRDSKFVALVQIREAGDGAALGRVWGRVAVGRVLPGDRVEVVTDPRGFLAALPEAVKVEIGSRLNLDTMRAKMRIGR